MEEEESDEATVALVRDAFKLGMTEDKGALYPAASHVKAT